MRQISRCCGWLLGWSLAGLLACGAALADTSKGVALYQKGQYTAAYQELLGPAQAGDALAQNVLGVLLANGKGGVKQDMPQALAWIRRAAAGGNTEATLTLGLAAFYGQGMPQDRVKGVMWLRKAAEKGDVSAQVMLGGAYNDGLGVKKDAAQATTWYRKAAEQGSAVAQTALGSMYYDGAGVPVDLKKSVALYRQAAEQGHLPAIVFLGLAYESGKGVKQDYQQAERWYQKGVARNDPHAQFRLAMLYDGHDYLTNKDAQAVALMMKASDAGWRDAQTILSGWYEMGSRGLPKDPAKAKALASKAAAP